MDFLLLLLQIAVVIAAARGVGWLFRKIHQPQVVGEMIAGILLGPSLLGLVAPAASAMLFPEDSLVFLVAVSEVGLVLFMFLVGLELDPKLLRGHGRTAVVTSHASIVAPFLLGALLALYLYPRLSVSSVEFTGFALFMGAAMSVTAFPVLARILTERNLLGTKVGTVSIACAAVDDVSAWSILALVLIVVRAGEAGMPLWGTLLGTAVYVALLLLVVRRGLRRLEDFYHSRGRVTQDLLAVVFLLVLASAWTTEWLGIHALFGAFALGAVMPQHGSFVDELMEKIEDFVVVFLLPVFFATAGLSTNVGLLSGGAEMWLFLGLALFVAVLGKFGGSAVAARLTGLSWKESGAIGILMNTRGLVELVILIIGLRLGVISQALFTILVIVALVTTFMTTPILEWFYPARRMRRQETPSGDGALPTDGAASVLVSVALPSSGPGLLRVASALRPSDEAPVHALHLRRSYDQPLIDIPDEEDLQETEALRPLLEAAREHAVPVHPLVFYSRDPGRDIRDTARVKGAGLVVMGWHKPVLNRNMLGGAVREVMRESTADVCVYVERRFQPWRRVLVPYHRGVHDRRAVAMAGRLAQRTKAEIVLLHFVDPDEPGRQAALRNTVEEQLFDGNVRLRLVETRTPLAALERAVQEEDYDLVFIGASEAWGLEPTIFGRRHERLAFASTASLLIVRAGAPASPHPAVSTLAEEMEEDR